jgi:hypothetical protein
LIKQKNASISLGDKKLNADTIINKIKEVETKRLNDFHNSNPASFLPIDISLSVEELRVGLEDGNGVYLIRRITLVMYLMRMNLGQ